MRYYLKYIEIAVIVVILLGLGIVRFSRLTPAQQREQDLRAGLEQLYQLEADHLARQKRYFDPRLAEFRPYLRWMDEVQHEVRWDGRTYSVVVYADLDGDGISGAWGVGSEGPEVEQLVED